MTLSERHALVVADGDVDPSDLGAALDLASAGGQRPMVIAADGGAAKALAAGVQPDLVVGDGDSLAPDVRDHLERAGVELSLASVDKDESDTELCLLAATARGARSLTVVGALGGERPEHAVANLLLMSDPRLDGVEVQLVDGPTRLVRIGSGEGPGRLDIDGEPGDWISLFALAGDVRGVSTTGLRFPLDDETLRPGPARGLSNELVERAATVITARGRLLVVHTPRARAALPGQDGG